MSKTHEGSNIKLVTLKKRLLGGNPGFLLFVLFSILLISVLKKIFFRKKENINHFKWFCRLMGEHCHDFKKKVLALSAPSHAKHLCIEALSPDISLSAIITNWGEDQGTCVHQALSTSCMLSTNTINATVIVRLCAKRRTRAKRFACNYWKLKNRLIL